MDYLSSGFSRVDSSQDPDVFFSCLKTLCSLPYFQDSKNRSFQLLDLKDGSTILETGCGLGQDEISIARLIGEHGRVAAIDSSRRMIKNACIGPDSIRLFLDKAFENGSFFCSYTGFLVFGEKPG